MRVAPTRGANDDQTWKARNGLAFAVRLLSFALPLVASLIVVRLVGHLLYRPPGLSGLFIWILQAAPVGAVTSTLVDRGSRRILPLATLLDLSMVFPDQAPSRFSIALRAGTVRKLTQRLDEIKTNGLGESENEAAITAIELVASLGRHDRLTRGHAERVRAYSDLIGEELGLSSEDQLRLSWGVLLHDMGKLSVPSKVLNKKSKLTKEEWELLKGHPQAGIDLLEPLAGWLGQWILAASEHHERWDGGGYPNGLSGTEISLAGRITAVADAYDVITSKRSYKKAMSTAAARQELVDCAGAQFDPDIVRAFLTVSLGKRWTFGKLAWLSDLPLGQLGSAATNAPVLAASGAVLAISSMVVVAEPEVVEPLPFTVVATAPTTTTTATTVATPEDSTLPPVTVRRSATPASTDAPTTSTSEAPSTTVATTSPSATQTPTTVLTTIPATQAPTTVLTTIPATTLPPITVPTTTVPTTTVPPTTTTTVPTTTTAPSSAHVYFLTNPGSGNSTHQTYKRLSDTHDGGTLPNFDTDRDAIAGLSLAPTGNGWSETDLSRIQRFGVGLSDQRLLGPVSLTFYAAVPDGAGPADLQIALGDCNHVYQSCTEIAGGTVTVSSTLSNGFQLLTVNLGQADYELGGWDNLVIRFITSGAETIHTGFDSDDTPSALTVTFAD